MRPCWIVTADERRAALFACSRGANGRWSARLERSIANPWEDAHERRRPSVLGRGPSASAMQHFAPLGHEQEEENRRFARDVREWIVRAAAELGARPLAAFATPRFLGLLREQLGEQGVCSHLREAG